MDKEELESLKNTDEAQFFKTINNFNTKHVSTFTFENFTISQKKILLEALFDHLQDKSCPNHVTYLETIRILSRDKVGLEELFPASSIDTLAELAKLRAKEEELISTSYTNAEIPVIVEAQKCLCNLIFNNFSIQRICSANGCVEGIMLRLRMYKDPGIPYEIKYFDMRMLFLLTALCADIRPKLRMQWHGLTYLMEALDLILKSNLEHHRTRGKKRFSRRKDKSQSSNKQQLLVPCLHDAEVDLACEVLKVLFNLSVSGPDKHNLDEEEEAHYLRMVSILHDTLLCNTKSESKKTQLHGHTVDLLTVIPGTAFEELLTPLTELPAGSDDAELDFEGYNMEAILVLLDFLEKKLKTQPDRTLKESLSPILTALAEISKANRIVRKFLKMKILPPLKDVMNKPEEGNTLRNRLCKLLTSADTDIKELVADLLFVLCKEKVSRLIKYTGYGNAAGLLANRGLMLGGSTGHYSSESEDTDTEEYLRYKDEINPVVGCYQGPRPDPMAGMTEEQKEYEAMQLVNVLDKMTMQNSCVKPMRIGEDGRPHPVEHVLELQDHLPHKNGCDQKGDSDSD